ncbi:hypothetical protein GCM10017786_30550 [Amycolatopsis deserti]|uniref:Serine/threonine protein kinase n=1 Tax=Amycolatopsis deserti TaxID=185696 RepID=A0ABQ3IVF6_9PSEU|nr:hypothetical protein [Amycolatopsis deserti]GHE95928.1 hypothetical protein GCM10017786_30550 [Amycolatopsis deserti]
MTRGAEFTDSSRSRTGRHRRGAGTWTPVVPAHRPAARRAPEPFYAPARGSLPLTERGPDTRPTADVFPPAHGELPVPQPAPSAQPTRQAQPGRKPQRTKVKLTPPRTRDADDTDVRVYEAAPVTGLGSFDLGNVPASVTPPRSWRKAAWFATASSGGVVVALMFAGSAFVAKPAPDQAGGAWVPGLGGGVPTLSGEQIAPPSGGGAQADTSSTSRDDIPAPATTSARPTESAGVRAPGPSTVRDTSTAGGTTSGSATATTTTSSVPRKPPPSPAPYEADPYRFTVYADEDPKTLASTSQSFLDTVTENPEAAASMTSGELRQEGPQGLERKYANVAYFQVKHIRVHQYDGKTVCTVQTVYKDGRQVTEERTLEFSGDKITSDGA